MPIVHTGKSVFDAALDRLVDLYSEGHRIVVSFSGGKDSTVCLELAIIAAQITNRLPVEVGMRDEEIMLPGTFEYCERVAARPEVEFHWYVANQPVINIYNRELPYFWTFDPALDPDEWVRKYPDFAEVIPEQNIQAMISRVRFPPAEGKDLFSVLGLRTQESMLRRMGLFSSGGWLTGKPGGRREARPIFDWGMGDVWKAIRDNKWDFNSAYNYMYKLGISANDLRIAPPTLSTAGIASIWVASQAYPQWFDRVCKRLPGVRQAALFGKRCVTVERRSTETWEECFHRAILGNSPKWIVDRAKTVADMVTASHARHSSSPFPDSRPCERCKMLGCWRRLCLTMYNGDPFSLKQSYLPYVEPEFFRAGAGTWGGKPTW